jgi:hypothetical protein
MSRSSGLFERRGPWDHEYAQAVKLVEELPGTVICPEDPTIPLYAKGHVGQNMFLEYDTHLVDGGWPTVPPAGFVASCRAADYVVDIVGYWQDILKDDLLRSLGFEPAPDIGPGLSSYRIWRRKTLGPAPAGSRTAQTDTARTEVHDGH